MDDPLLVTGLKRIPYSNHGMFDAHIFAVSKNKEKMEIMRSEVGLYNRNGQVSLKSHEILCVCVRVNKTKCRRWKSSRDPFYSQSLIKIFQKSAK